MAPILVIDDDATTQIVLRKVLQSQGYEVILADNGAEGMVQAKKHSPSLIICDWMMPVMDGLEVCRRIKADPELATTFFILLTSKGAIEDRVRGLDTGADDFLAKPVELSELKARVRAGLRLYQVNRDLQQQKEMLEAELAEAAEYVKSLLPRPLQSPALTIDASFIPSRQLGGDCFDYYWLDPDYLAIYLLDVSGHGLGAALPSISVLNLLRSQSPDEVNLYQPHYVLEALNENFQMDSHNAKYFTIWYGVYNQVKRQLSYACAGHPPAILITPPAQEAKAQVQQLKTVGLPIGMWPDARYTSDRLTVEPGSTLYIFSDGVYEVSRPDGSIWGLEAFIQLLTQRSQTPLPPDLEEILQAIQEINPGEPFPDDLSLLQLRFTDSNSPEL